MKTLRQLLDFYEVKRGQKYVVTKSLDTYPEVGQSFKIVIRRFSRMHNDFVLYVLMDTGHRLDISKLNRMKYEAKSNDRHHT